jgi:histidine triad (HIT) family protein
MPEACAGFEDCFICSKHALGDAAECGVIWSDGIVYAGHCHLMDRQDIHLGWLMVEPYRHVAGLGDLTRQEAAAIGIMCSRLAKALCESEGAEHVYSFVFGDGLARAHLHVHLMARYAGTPREYWQQRVVEWPDGRRGGPEEVRALSQRVRQHLTAASLAET